MNNEDKILKKLDNHEAIFSEHNRVVNKQNRLMNKMLEVLNDQGQILKVHSKLFVGLENKLINHDELFEKIGLQLIEHDKHFEKIEIKLFNRDEKFIVIEHKINKIDISVNEMKDVLDGVALMLRKLNEEKTANDHRVSELDETVQSHTKDILILKRHINLAT